MTSFTSVVNPNASEQEFRIEISYIGLPDPITTKYEIDNEKLIVYKELYSNSVDKFEKHDVLEIKNFDRQKIVKFLNRTDWASLPKTMDNTVIDGYHYKVNLEVQGQKYEYKISNSYHATYDSLFSITTCLLPKKRMRKHYNLPYSD